MGPVKGNYKSRRDSRILDPTLLGGPRKPLFSWRAGTFGPGNTVLSLYAKFVVSQEDGSNIQIGGVFALLTGQYLPRDGFWYDDGAGGVNPLTILCIDNELLLLQFAAAQPDGSLMIDGDTVQFRGSGGQSASSAELPYVAI